MKEKRKAILVSILGTLGLILMIVGATYAWFSTNITGDGPEINVTTATVGPLTYTANEITATGVLPGWISEEDTLTINGNASGVELEYYCYIENTGEIGNIEYRVSNDGENDSTNGTWESTNVNPIVTGTITNENKEDVYKLAIRYKETGSDQNAEQGKRLSIKVKCNIVEEVTACESGTLCNKILSDNKYIQTRETFNKTYEANNNGNTIFKEEFVQDGVEYTTYYFAGAVTNNYVKFGKNSNGSDLYWRIVRINEDNSVRLIYAGTSATDTAAFISTSQTYSINDTTYDKSYYVGYEYAEGEQHGTGTNSGIKIVVDDWYTSNLSEEDAYISKTAIYCNDRTIGSGFTWATNPSDGHEYAGNERLTSKYTSSPYYEKNVIPTFACSKNEDRFTKSSTTGNGKLEYPIALITADEVSYAGGLFAEQNPNYYLSQNASSGATYWWTMTSSYWSNVSAGMFYVGGSNGTGRLGYNSVYQTRGVRPVLSLKSCVEWKSGDGTSGNPYIVQISDECALKEN